MDFFYHKGSQSTSQRNTKEHKGGNQYKLLFQHPWLGGVVEVEVEVEVEVVKVPESLYLIFLKIYEADYHVDEPARVNT